MDPVSDGEGIACPLSVDDCRCPVCLEIFIEPVTLPCSHTFCKNCFLESVDKATLCCPMCRKRVSTWARQNARNNSLVNQKLWSQIQICFPLQYQRRLSGQEAEDDAAVSVCFPKVSEPGEVRQEYEDQITKLKEEKRALDEEERRASEEYIQRLLAEEQELLQQEIRRKEEDEQLARMLSVQLNSAPALKKKDVGAGQIERFLCPLASKNISPDFNKENIGFSQVEQPLTKLNCYGSEPPTLHPRLHSEDQTFRNLVITDGQPSSSKRKSSELAEEDEVVLTKRGCPPTLEVEELAIQEGFKWKEEVLSKQQQEEEDRHLALLLQKELDDKEKQRCTDRSKGSAGAYLLRHHGGDKVEVCTPSKASKKTTKSSTSSPSSAAPLKNTKSSTASSPSSSCKQTTLTELFSNLSS